jgi:Zn-finger nucleic acid-binding protein
MLRQNFRESSGIVVDVCSADGIWLDRGELATLIEFAATGAMAEAERRIGERADARKRLDAWGEDLRAVGPRHYVDAGGALIAVDGIANVGDPLGLVPDDD